MLLYLSCICVYELLVTKLDDYDTFECPIHGPRTR